jgi:hypothetical protein
LGALGRGSRFAGEVGASAGREAEGSLLKGSGRVNRILGPEEDLTDALAKSVRLAKRQREQ